MRIDIITLFPEMFSGVFGDSIIKRAADNGILDIHFTNPRDFTDDKHHHVDDTPFGGGSGMVMMPDPAFRAMESVEKDSEDLDSSERHRVLLSPAGVPFTQKKAIELARYRQLVFLCGHYEGFDHRIEENIVDEAISIGDYVLTGGELPAMVIVDAVSTMLPGVLGSPDSAPTDSFYDGLLEFPQYTRPREYRGMCVPEVLFSGDHARIREWRRRESIRRTKELRPDLLESAELTAKDRLFLEEIETKDH